MKDQMFDYPCGWQSLSTMTGEMWEGSDPGTNGEVRLDLERDNNLMACISEELGF